MPKYHTSTCWPLSLSLYSSLSSDGSGWPSQDGDEIALVRRTFLHLPSTQLLRPNSVVQSTTEAGTSRDAGFEGMVAVVTVMKLGLVVLFRCFGCQVVVGGGV